MSPHCMESDCGAMQADNPEPDASVTAEVCGVLDTDGVVSEAGTAGDISDPHTPEDTGASGATTDPSAYMGTQRVPTLLLRVAWPSVIGMLVQALYNVVDSIFVAQGVGTMGVGALAVFLPIEVTLYAAIGNVFGSGAAAMIARSLGANDTKRAEAVLLNMLVACAAQSIIIPLAFLPWFSTFLRLFGATDAILPGALEYGRILTVFVCSYMFGQSLPHILRALGYERLSMQMVVASACINMVIDPLLIFGFDMGISGAAISTVVAQTVPAVLAILFLMKETQPVRIRFDRDIDFAIMRRFLGLGFPQMGQQSSQALPVVLGNALIKHFADPADVDTLIVVFSGILQRYLALLILPIIGMTAGYLPVASYNLGAKNYHRFMRVVLYGLLFSGSIATVGWLGTLLAPALIVQVLGGDDPALTDLGVSVMRHWCYGFLLVCFPYVAAATFQAQSQALLATAVALARQMLIMLPTMAIMPMITGNIESMFYAGTVSDVCAAVSSMLLMGWYVYRPLVPLLAEEKREREEAEGADALESQCNAETPEGEGEGESVVETLAVPTCGEGEVAVEVADE
ncbi:multi antimicrobial extrusion protein [Kipferlia bialata]|uniref:Multi antimicrobial extrusion protein n=1 Tax=Kipferlia bialata TaxID=797122 RepID=A0A9K3CQU0_9EUKA|nr:multi antimicrobial extrusion protein [Kipferlia bialata]|eukprot:g616.t1